MPEQEQQLDQSVRAGVCDAIEIEIASENSTNTYLIDWWIDNRFSKSHTTSRSRERPEVAKVLRTGRL